MDELSLTQTTATAAHDLSGRAGFDANFLGQAVPIPVADGVETVLLPYTHFSVLMRLDKRLAAVTAVGIDGEKLMDLDRSGIKWRLDPRLAEGQQTGERVYAGNDIDRGHLVRRASAVWATAGPRRPRPTRTPFTTRTRPRRLPGSTQGLDLWLGLESSCWKRRGPWPPAHRLHRADLQRC